MSECKGCGYEPGQYQFCICGGLPTMRPPPPKVTGVSRVGDNEKVIAVSFSRRLTDNEMRAFHDYLRGFQ